MSHWLLDEKFCNEYLKYSTSNRNRGGLGAVSSNGGVSGLNSHGSMVVGDPKVTASVGASSAGITMAGGLNTLYAIAAGGVRRDHRR